MIAVAGLGIAAIGWPRNEVRFTDVTQSAGIKFKHNSGRIFRKR
jgi:hypothetical protein